MKINFELIRDLLFTIEEQSNGHSYVRFINHSPYGCNIRTCLGVDETPPIPQYQLALERKYDVEQIFYHLNHCVEGELVHPPLPDTAPDFFTLDLTFKGHEYINLIREDTHWNKIKEYLRKIGEPLSIQAIQQAGTTLLNKAIQSLIQSL